MKVLIVPVFLSLMGMAYGDSYFKNNGSAPESLTKKSNKVNVQTRVYEEEEQVPMNTSSTPAPSSHQEVIENTTLIGAPVNRTTPLKEEAKEAQEEDALDYSTTPQKKQ